MANYQLLKLDIDKKVYENAQQKITGESLNSVLIAMVTTLGAEYQFAGVATKDTNPEISDAKVFYIANGKGTYTNFGSLEVTEDEVVVLYYDTEWHKVATGIAADAKLKEAVTELTEIAGKINTKQDIIPDLESIREGAEKGSTALQKESDPVYLADKPSLLREIDGKVSKVEGKGLSSNDFTDAEKLKLAGLENYDDTQVRALIAGKADKATTLAGYGIADAYTKNEVDAAIEGKQDTIPDLDSIREGAALGKTALQEHQDISGLATKEELNGKQDKLVPGDNITIVGNVISSTGGGGGGGGSVDLSAYAKKEEVDAALAGKQDTIADLDAIRQGAQKGSTALQKESDPVYLADKPKLALKVEIPDVSGKVDKVEGKGLSSNDFTDAEKLKLAGLENYDDTQVRALIAGKADKATTLAGYGIADAYTKNEVDAAIEGKQDTIPDLDSIREGAALGKTALQEHQDISGLATKEELNGKQDKLVPGDNITIVGNVISSTGGGGGGGGSVDLSAYAKKEEVDAALAGKQDTIADLDAIRQGAQKGSTALQKESDPVYLADKPKLALKVEIPDVSGKVDKVEGKGLSSNDFTDAEKAKLAGLENYDDIEVRRLIEEKQDRMTIDSALSSTSANPVQNKVVKAALDAKQAKLTAGSGIIINGSEISTAYKIWHGSQAEYDAIAAKDDMTIYLIEES